MEWGFKPREQVEAETEFALAQMGLEPGSSVLDIGCGPGVAAVKMSRMGFDVTALDISPVFVEAARDLEKREGGLSQPISWCVADFFEFDSRPCDAAILLDPGLDVPTTRFTQKLSRLVKPGGRFFLRYKNGITGIPARPPRD